MNKKQFSDKLSIKHFLTNEQETIFDQTNKWQFSDKISIKHFLTNKQETIFDQMNTWQLSNKKKPFKVWPKQNISVFSPNFSNFHLNCKFLDEKNIPESEMTTRKNPSTVSALKVHIESWVSSTQSTFCAVLINC